MLKENIERDPEYKEMIKLNEELGEEFFDDQTRSFNPIRAWFHKSRYEIIDRLVRKYYTRKNMVIVDMGCGSCNWNTKCLPVIGIDINEKMPKYAKEAGRLRDYRVEDLSKTSLKDSSVDIIVISETLEHIPNYTDTITEIRRVLKPGGAVIVTVPYDTNLSLWKPFFAIQCFVQGTILGKELYKKKCGHVNHFSPKGIRESFENAGFSTEKQLHNKYFTIITVARKK